jgi:hypothetical protein
MWRAGIAAVFMIAAFAAAAQSSGGSTRPFAAISSDTLVERYQDLAGSRENAQTIISALRDGIDFNLGSGNVVTTFHPPAVKMSDANIENALAVTQAALLARSIDKPKPDQVGTMLMDVLQMRVEGKDWRQVADALGFKSPK